jgi:hypothetical protein
MCHYSVAPGVPLVLTASQTKPDKMFQMWMDACSGSQPTCALTPSSNTHVGAKFE